VANLPLQPGSPGGKKGSETTPSATHLPFLFTMINSTVPRFPRLPSSATGCRDCWLEVRSPRLKGVHLQCPPPLPTGANTLQAASGGPPHSEDERRSSSGKVALLGEGQRGSRVSAQRNARAQLDLSASRIPKHDLEAADPTPGGAQFPVMPRSTDSSVAYWR
jgi:hypothetical protein